MSRLSLLNNPMLLGFDEIERLLSRSGKSAGDGYPPYNIEKLDSDEQTGDLLRITIAVAGFQPKQLSVTLDDNQLCVKGHQGDDDTGDYLHRGIAARQFVRTFVLAEGIKVIGAELKTGLLSINLNRPPVQHTVQKIEIKDLG